MPVRHRIEDALGQQRPEELDLLLVAGRAEPAALAEEKANRRSSLQYERLYLPDKGIADDYPNLAGVFARPIRWDLIEQQYDEMVKAAVALKRGTATAEAILKRYNAYNVTHPT